MEKVFFSIARDIKQRLAESTEATKPEVGRHSPGLGSLFRPNSDHNVGLWGVEQSKPNIVIRANTVPKKSLKSSCCSGN